jgi:two-component system, OmpR family, phosphate regulon sensor histidine kinase PhoR
MKTRFFIHRTFGRMKRNVFLLIVVINSVALIGIFFTQIFWIREAYNLLNEQFTGTVRVALKGVVNQMLDYELKYEKKVFSLSSDSLSLFTPEAPDINMNLLEFKINEEFRCMQVGKDFEFAVIDRRNQSLVKGKYERYKKELLQSPNQVILTGFHDAENFALSAWFPEQHKLVLMELYHWIIISVLFAVVLIIGFPVSLFIFNRQKKLSGMKSDFINNMTHEFKTPIATISLASEMLLKKQVQGDPEKAVRYARIIYDENTRLQNHVEQILSVSMLERGQFRLKKKLTDIHQLISEIVENFSITVKEREGKIRTHFCATEFVMEVDKSHLTNVIINLLDNANKYSAEKPWIRIGTQNTDNGLTITVEDRGMGISLENQRQVFRNLYRVPTGNIYNVKGFGIGLYYVKTIIEAHGGHINLKSELNKGSRFDVYLPFVIKPAEDDKYNQT